MTRWIAAAALLLAACGGARPAGPADAKPNGPGPSSQPSGAFQPGLQADGAVAFERSVR